MSNQSFKDTPLIIDNQHICVTNEQQQVVGQLAFNF